MPFRSSLPSLSSASLLFVAGLSSAQTLEEQFKTTIAVAAERYEAITTTVLSGNRERFVSYTDAAGNWDVVNDGSWTCGFLPGSFWHLYELTGDSKWSTYAMKWDGGVRSRATASDNDTGFQIMESFETGLQFGTDAIDANDYRSVVLQGAETTVNQRWNDTIGCIRGWPSNANNPTTTPFEVIIDMMMNLEIMFWAAENGGPAEYKDYAIRHADKTWENNVRADYSTYHVVEYNLAGEVVNRRTHQGWRTASTWSRGQAWAVYGYTMAYRYTELPRMLERAGHLFDYFVAATDAQSDDAVPYSDFDALLDAQNPRDASAGAIFASACLELWKLSGDSKYLDRAEQVLLSLTAPPYVDPASSVEPLVFKASSRWGAHESGAAFADFYLLEAIWRHRQWPRVQTGLWRGFPLYDKYADTGDWLGWVAVENDPWIYLFGLETWCYLVPDSETGTGNWTYMFKP